MDKAEKIANAIADCEERRARGESLDLEELLRSDPEIAEELRFHFELHDLLGGASSDGDSESSAAIPTQVGEYRIVREIGRGGMGVVYEAVQQSMERRVALKVLSTRYLQTATAVRRFQREARAGGRLHHTNIVPIHDMGQHEGLWFYAMDLVEGRALDRVVDELKEARLHARGSSVSAPTSTHLGTDTANHGFCTRAAELFAGVAEALETAHQAGVIHRDIKPSNLLLDAKGVLMIVDFGVARIEDGAASMTMTGDLIGTPAYMSPEQAAVKRIEIDHRTDIYSLGATMYEVLTLEPPFRGERVQHLCEQIVTRDPASPRRLNRHLARDLETIVLKAMEKERDKRYATAGEFARDLRRFAEGGSIQARRIGLTGRVWRKVKRQKARSILVAGLLIALVLGGYLGLKVRADSERRRELRYAQLCARAEHAVIAAHSSHEDARGERVAEACKCFAEAIALEPERPEAYLGRALLTGHKLELKLADLDAAYERGLPAQTWRVVRARFLGTSGPNRDADAEAVPVDGYLEARELADQRRWAEVRQALARTLSVRGTSVALRYLALRLRVIACMQVDAPAEALEDLLQMEALGDDSASLCAAIASQWRRLEQKERAETRFGQALERAEQAGTEESWLSLCRELHGLPDYELMERAASAALKLFPSSWSLLVEHADALRHLGRHDEAFAVCARAVLLGPNQFAPHFNQANVLASLGRYEEALTAFDRAIGIDEKRAEAHYNKGNSFWELERFAESLKAYERAIEIDPNEPDAHGNRGDALMKLENYEEAVRAWSRASELDPQNLDYQLALGWTLTHLERTEEAVAAYGKALELDPRSTHAMVGLAWWLATSPNPSVRDVPRAVELARQGVVLAPENGGLRNTLGIALYRAGEWEESMLAFEKSMELKRGGDAYDWFFVAMLYARKKDEAKAREWFDKAVAGMKEDVSHGHGDDLERFRSEAQEALASMTSTH